MIGIKRFRSKYGKRGRLKSGKESKIWKVGSRTSLVNSHKSVLEATRILKSHEKNLILFYAD